MRKNSGFTLIEMMIAVAIVGILAAIAYPSYQESVRKSNRSDAIGELSDIALRVQRCYTSYSTYDTAAGRCSVIDSLKDAAGITSKGGLYVIKGSNIAKTTYTITATPVSGRSQASDKSCASFSLTHTGVKAAKDINNADATAKCW